MKFKKGDKIIYVNMHARQITYGEVGYIKKYSGQTYRNGSEVYRVDFISTANYAVLEQSMIHYSKEAMLKFNLDSTIKEN